MQHKTYDFPELIPEESVPFHLALLSKKENIVFISQNYDFLEKIHHNLNFLGCASALLAPRFSFYINHTSLNNYTFLQNYIKAFENPPKVMLIHDTLLSLPMPEPDAYGSFHLNAGKNISTQEITGQLSDFGYISSPVVHNPAEFAMRGYIVDFATTQENIRIEFLGSTIESIKYFDTESQRSSNSIEEITIYPNNFLLPSFCNFEKFSAKYQIAFQEENSQLCENIVNHPESCDINKYVNLLVNDTVNVLDLFDGKIYLHNLTHDRILEQKEIKFFEKTNKISHGSLYFSQEEITKAYKNRDFQTIATL